SLRGLLSLYAFLIDHQRRHRQTHVLHGKSVRPFAAFHLSLARSGRRDRLSESERAGRSLRKRLRYGRRYRPGREYLASPAGDGGGDFAASIRDLYAAV